MFEDMDCDTPLEEGDEEALQKPSRSFKERAVRRRTRLSLELKRLDDFLLILEQHPELERFAELANCI